MCQFDNLFEEALNAADGHIIRTMGKDVVLYLSGGNKTIRAVFDSPDAPSSLPRGAAYVEDVAPTIFAFTRDLAGLRKGDRVDVAGEIYRVVRVKPDDVGCSTVILAVGKGGDGVPDIDGRWSR